MTSIDLLQIQNFILNHKNDTTFPNHLHWIPFLISHPNNSLLHLNTLRILSRDKSLISQNYDLWTNWLIWLSLEIDGFAGDELKDVLSIMNKLVVQNFQLEQKLIYQILECLRYRESQMLRLVLTLILSILNKQNIIDQIKDLFYIHRITQALSNGDQQVKSIAVNLNVFLLDHPAVVPMFQKLNYERILTVEIKLASNYTQIVSLLSCLYKFLLTTDADSKWSSLIISQLDTLLKKRNNYMETTTVINILTQLANHLISAQLIMQYSFLTIVQLIIDSHAIYRQNKLHFSDLEVQNLDPAIDEMQVYLFKLLRYLFSYEKHKKVVKDLFPPNLFSLFVDVGNFNKNLAKYQTVVHFFNQDQQEIIKIVTNITNKQENEISMIKDYEFHELIGKGAFGSVFVVKQNKKTFALKHIQFSSLESKGKLDRNLSNNCSEYEEVKMLSLVNHHNIVKLEKCFIANEGICIVMEYIDGYSLAELIRQKIEKQQQFTEKEIWNILMQLLVVLSYLDKIKIIHRDLNPTNIMIPSNGMYLKLVDFGLATQLTQTYINQQFVGTLLYSSPEIVQNQQYNQKSDIWSLGCIAYELVKLKQPFTSNNPLTLANKIVNMDMDKDLTAVSPQMQSFISNCLCIDQNSRYSANQLLSSYSDKLKEYVEEQQLRILDMQQECQVVINKLQEIDRPEKMIVKVNVEQLNESDIVEQMIWMTSKLSELFNDSQTRKESKYLIDQFYILVIQEKQNTKVHLSKLIQKSMECIGVSDTVSYEQLWHMIYSK